MTEFYATLFKLILKVFIAEVCAFHVYSWLCVFKVNYPIPIAPILTIEDGLST